MAPSQPINTAQYLSPFHTHLPKLYQRWRPLLFRFLEKWVLRSRRCIVSSVCNLDGDGKGWLFPGRDTCKCPLFSLLDPLNSPANKHEVCAESEIRCSRSFLLAFPSQCRDLQIVFFLVLFFSKHNPPNPTAKASILLISPIPSASLCNTYSHHSTLPWSFRKCKLISLWRRCSAWAAHRRKWQIGCGGERGRVGLCDVDVITCGIRDGPLLPLMWCRDRGSPSGLSQARPFHYCLW